MLLTVLWVLAGLPDAHCSVSIGVALHVIMHLWTLVTPVALLRVYIHIYIYAPRPGQAGP